MTRPLLCATPAFYRSPPGGAIEMVIPGPDGGAPAVQPIDDATALAHLVRIAATLQPAGVAAPAGDRPPPVPVDNRAALVYVIDLAQALLRRLPPGDR